MSKDFVDKATRLTCKPPIWAFTMSGTSASGETIYIGIARADGIPPRQIAMGGECSTPEAALEALYKQLAEEIRDKFADGDWPICGYTRLLDAYTADRNWSMEEKLMLDGDMMSMICILNGETYRMNGDVCGHTIVANVHKFIYTKLIENEISIQGEKLMFRGEHMLTVGAGLDAAKYTKRLAKDIAKRDKKNLPSIAGYFAKPDAPPVAA